jgi:non-heme chloroperoxidase
LFVGAFLNGRDPATKGSRSMGFVTVADGARIFCKDWVPAVRWSLAMAGRSRGQPGCAGAATRPNGYRIVAHDRRVRGRFTRTWDGKDTDMYADDLAAMLDDSSRG